MVHQWLAWTHGYGSIGLSIMSHASRGWKSCLCVRRRGCSSPSSQWLCPPMPHPLSFEWKLSHSELSQISLCVCLCERLLPGCILVDLHSLSIISRPSLPHNTSPTMQPGQC